MIPYTGNPGKNEYPCILYEIDENDVDIIGYSPSDANVGFNKHEFISWPNLYELEITDLNGKKTEIKFKYSEMRQRIEKEIKEKHPNITVESEKFKELFAKKMQKYYNEQISKHKGFIQNKHAWEPEKVYIGNLTNNLTNDEIISFYTKNNQNFRDKVKKILKIGIQKIDNSIEKQNTIMFNRSKTIQRYEDCVIEKLNDNEYKILYPEYWPECLQHKVYINKNNQIMHYSYNEFVLEPKQKDRIVHSKGLTLCFFHNNKQKAKETKRECKNAELYARKNNIEFNKDKYWIDEDGYQTFTTKEICETIMNNFDKIIKFQKAKRLDTIKIIDENGKMKTIKLSELKQFVANKMHNAEVENNHLMDERNIITNIQPVYGHQIKVSKEIKDRSMNKLKHSKRINIDNYYDYDTNRIDNINFTNKTENDKKILQTKPCFKSNIKKHNERYDNSDYIRYLSAQSKPMSCQRKTVKVTKLNNSMDSNIIFNQYYCNNKPNVNTNQYFKQNSEPKNNTKRNINNKITLGTSIDQYFNNIYR